MCIRDSDIPMNYDVVFNGWNRTPDYVPSSAVGIHHPRGDIKKISIDQDSLSIYENPIFWSNGAITPPEHHFKLDLDVGTIEMVLLEVHCLMKMDLLLVNFMVAMLIVISIFMSFIMDVLLFLGKKEIRLTLVLKIG